jgi:hypothetical protein
MTTYAVVAQDGTIVNRIVLDDPKAWTPEDGHSIVEEKSFALEIGGLLKGGKYTPPKAILTSLVKPPPAMAPAEKLLAATGLSVAELKALLK